MSNIPAPSDIRSLLRRLPYASAIARQLRRIGSYVTDAQSLTILRSSGSPLYSAVFSSLSDAPTALSHAERETIAAIENERRRLSRTDLPLADGTCGAGGPYDDVTVAAACGVSKPPKAGRLLFALVRTCRPRHILELGTNLGISSSYMASAQRFNANDGNVTTLEASQYRIRIAREVHSRLGLSNIRSVQGLFETTLAGVLGGDDLYDMAFIDGNHQFQPTLDYFEMIMACSSPEAVFVFDDIRWSDGMLRAWDRVRTDPRICLAIDLRTVGICFRRPPPVTLRLPGMLL